MEPGAVRAQLDRILASRVFSDAERARRFLSFVTGRALEGRASEIKESVIAIEAFGRDSSFDSKCDPVVRVEARRLRDRLSAYYSTEGVADGILINLPKGGYVPEFAERPQAEQQVPTKRAVGRMGPPCCKCSGARAILFTKTRSDRHTAALHSATPRCSVRIVRHLAGWPKARVHCRFQWQIDALGSPTRFTRGETTARH